MAINDDMQLTAIVNLIRVKVSAYLALINNANSNSNRASKATAARISKIHITTIRTTTTAIAINITIANIAIAINTKLKRLSAKFLKSWL